MNEKSIGNSSGIYFVDKSCRMRSACFGYGWGRFHGRAKQTGRSREPDGNRKSGGDRCSHSTGGF